MSDGYGRDRDGFEPHVRGRIFEHGTEKFFRDREKGYAQGSRKYEFRDQNGRTERIKFDKIKNEHDRSRAESIEEKSGRIKGDKDEKQLRGVRELLKRGEINRHMLRSVEGEFISKEAQELIRGLIRDFGDRFQHQIISRADAREIWVRGLELEPGRQLELPGVGEKARQQRAQQRETRTQEREARAQEQLQQRPRTQEATQRSIEKQGREPRAPEQRQQQREAADRLAQRAHERREAQARGERTPMSAREAADVLRLGPPTLSAETPRRELPQVAPTVRHSRNRSLERERDRSRGIERER
ncbi:hypothetical protein ACFWPH_28625 [Nocardia sp. NPDC058499]|uniref:hypothetical protein n=1 Tax=Nocardia sp. NPDC058499 TaxID=3346530 RepID=UPI00365DD684